MGDNIYKDINVNNLYNLNKISFINKECWDLFSFEKDTSIKAHGLYKKNKLIVSIENNCYYIADFSGKDHKKECNIIFDENNKRSSKIIQEIINNGDIFNFFNSLKINTKNDNMDIQKIVHDEQIFLFEDISFFNPKKPINNINNNSHTSDKFKKNNINNKKNNINNKKNHNESSVKPKKKISHPINIDNNNPCLVGLTNIGSTCYMNAVLQCLSNVKHLTNYLFKEDVMKIIEKNKDSKLFLYEYLQLLKHLWLLDEKDIEYYGKNKSFSPHTFKNVLGKMNDLFLKNEANDSKDLIIFMQEQLHKDLNFLDGKTNNIQINLNNNSNMINQFNENEVRKSFFNFFMQNYNSIISNLFYGTQKTITNCCMCGISTYNYQIISYLFFPLEAVRQYLSIPYNGNTIYVTIYDCFNYFQQKTYLTGQNKISCNHCKQISDAFYINKICIMPNILIIVLNRGKGLQYNVNLNIDEIVDLSNYIELNQGNFKYQLIGTIIHYGNSGQDGHFIAICRNKNDGQWYKYNDSIINATTFNEIKTTGIPYVLFYQVIK